MLVKFPSIEGILDTESDEELPIQEDLVEYVPRPEDELEVEEQDLLDEEEMDEYVNGDITKWENYHADRIKAVTRLISNSGGGPAIKPLWHGVEVVKGTEMYGVARSLAHSHYQDVQTRTDTINRVLDLQKKLVGKAPLPTEKATRCLASVKEYEKSRRSKLFLESGLKDSGSSSM